MGENVRRTVKRNSKERDKDARSGTKCNRQNPLPSKKNKTKQKNMGTCRWLLEVAEIARGGTDDSKNDELKYTNCVVDSKCGHTEC